MPKNDDEDEKKYEKHQEILRNGFCIEDTIGCCDEAIAVAFQYHTNPKEIDVLIKAGVTVEEIISGFNKSSPKSKPSTPVIVIKDDI